MEETDLEALDTMQYAGPQHVVTHLPGRWLLCLFLLPGGRPRRLWPHADYCFGSGLINLDGSRLKP
jgi:hypothetical protein